MSKTSKKYFNEIFIKEIWESFEKEIKKTNTYKDIIKVLGSILTVEEKILIEKRLAIKLLLDKKIPIKEISRVVDVDRKTIWFIRDGFKRKVYKKMQKGFILPSRSNKSSGTRLRKYRYIRKEK